MDIHGVMDQEELQLKRLNDLVQDAVREEEILSSKLIEMEQDAELTLGQRWADHVAQFGGSWTFIALFFLVLLAWVGLNLWVLREKAFDPYPFIFLNLILSCIAAIQAPVIMMSQNRQEEKDRRRARGDYMINLKAEMEIRSLHSKVDLLIAEQMKSLFSIQQVQLEILQRIEKKLGS